jgi:hypothetical protein
MVILPSEAHPRILEVRREFLTRIVEAIEESNAGLAEGVREAIDRIAARKWTRKAIKQELGKLYAKYQTRVESNLIDLVRDSTTYGERYAERIERYGLMGAATIPKSEVQWAYEAKGGARAVAAYVKQRAAAAKKLFQGELTLSDRLHKMTRRELRDVTRRVLTAIREGRAIGEVGRELLDAVPGLGEAYKVPPKTLTRFTKAVRRMETLLDVDHSKELKRLEKYVARLKEGGRVQSAYREVIQDLTKYDPKTPKAQAKLTRAVQKFTHHKQRMAAERILNTESQTAFRSAGLDRNEGKPWIIGYRWEMNRGLHSRFKKRTKVKRHRKPARKRKFGGKRCICEVMQGKVLTPAEVREWLQGGHPNCGCRFKPVYDESKMMTADITPEEEGWLTEQGL